jgi:hypothetical protein
MAPAAAEHHVDNIGYVKKPTFVDDSRHVDDGRLHIVFSSGCNQFQHWQAELLLATAHAVGQRGRITRIVSGCHDKSAETAKHTHQAFPKGKGDHLVPMNMLLKSVNPHFGLFVTPTFEGAIDFPWINKPSSIAYFLKETKAELEAAGETVIAILDPDFVFLKPLSQQGSTPDNLLHHNPVAASGPPVDIVRRGKPVAQFYAIGGAWVKTFDIAGMTGNPNSPALKYSYQGAVENFAVGPPLMMHVDDLREMAPLWAKFMKPVVEHKKDILADMFAYSIASAHLGLEHTVLDQFMISAWMYGGSEKGQAWPWLAQWKEQHISGEHRVSCANPVPGPGQKVPTFIHLASNFEGPEIDEGEWQFHKGKVPPDILECSVPLLISAPDDLYDLSYSHYKTDISAFVI